MSRDPVLTAHTAAMTDACRGAFAAGYQDGLDQPDELSMGLTYEDTVLNEAYDYGVSIGQQVARWQRAV